MNTSRPHLRLRLPGAFALLFALLIPAGIAAQSESDFRTRVAIIPMANQTGEDAYDSVATTVSDTVGLVLRLLGSYAVTEAYDLPELDQVDFSDPDNLHALAEEHRFEEVVFGDVTRNERRELEFTLSLYNREEDTVKYRESAVAATVFDVFDAADEITIALVEEMSDIRIGFGSLVVERASGQGAYSIHLNGERIRNPESNLERVLNGTYTLTIHQNRLLGNTVIFEREVDVLENEETIVEFEIPEATAEEKAYLEEQRAEIQALADSGAEIEELLEAIAEFQATARRAESDPELRTLSESILEDATQSATRTLTALMEQADGAYYDERPDFESARDVYARFGSLINDVYEFSVGEYGALSGPEKIAATADGSRSYVLAGTSTIRVLDQDLREIDTIPTRLPLNPAPELTVGSDGFVYATHPTVDYVIVYSPEDDVTVEIELEEMPLDAGVPRVIASTAQGFVYVIQGTAVRVYDAQAGGERNTSIEERIADALSVQGFQPSHAQVDAGDNVVLFDEDTTEVLTLTYLGEMMQLAGLEIDALAESHVDAVDFGVDRIGNFYLLNADEHEVLKFNRSGSFVAKIGSFGADPGELQSPNGLWLYGDGSMLIADTFNNRIQRFELVATPIVLPEVAQFGVRFAGRETTATRAIERMEIVSESIRPLRPIGQLTGATVFAGGSFGLSLAAGLATESAYELYDEYLATTDPAELSSLRADVERQWVMSRAFMSGTIASVGIASILLTNAILTTTDYASARRKAIGQLQAISMDKEYETDADRWRSLRAAQRVGFFTGVMPPVLGGAAAITISQVGWEPLGPDTAEYALLAGVGSPPIFSHLVGGRFHVGLALAGLVADALAGLGYWIAFERGDAWEPAPLLGNETTLGRMWREIEIQAPLLLMAAGLGVRFTAGVYDTQNGWLETRDFNAYEAIRPIGE